MVDYNKKELKLRLSTLDCNTSTKYYQLTHTINEKQKHQIKEYFQYYTPEHFSNLDKVAGNTTGWMCKSQDVKKVEQVLGITETIEKRKAKLDKQERKNNDTIQNIFNSHEFVLSK
ncbi:MAG: hypothetical protein IJJ47_04895 [Methanosphaera sp.]|nr:hypothetical protein [Methanosphaera sp.]